MSGSVDPKLPYGSVVLPSAKKVNHHSVLRSFDSTLQSVDDVKNRCVSSMHGLPH